MLPSCRPEAPGVARLRGSARRFGVSSAPQPMRLLSVGGGLRDQSQRLAGLCDPAPSDVACTAVDAKRGARAFEKDQLFGHERIVARGCDIDLSGKVDVTERDAMARARYILPW